MEGYDYGSGSLVTSHEGSLLTGEAMLIGKVGFLALSKMTMRKSNNIPTKKTDEEYADHMSANAPEFSVSGTVRKKDLTTLNNLADALERVQFISGFGCYENMAIQNLNVEEVGYLDTYPFSCTLKQIRVGKTKKVTLSLPLAPAESAVTGNTTATSPTSKNVKSAPSPTKTNTPLKYLTSNYQTERKT